MPQPLLQMILNCLDPQALARSEQVCSNWHGILGNGNASFWRARCLNLQPKAPDSETEVKADLDDAKVMISTPAINFKALALPLFGDLFVMPHYYMMSTKKNSSGSSSVCVATIVTNPASQSECARLHGNKCDKDFRGSWQDNYSDIKDFPKKLPLRLFINCDGSFKNNGEKVFLYYAKKFVILTCSFKPTQPTHGHDDMGAVDFRQEILARVRTSAPLLQDAIVKEQGSLSQNTWTNLDNLI